MSLKDKNVVVTGGSRGLGLGLVEALVVHSARVTVVARDANALGVRPRSAGRRHDLRRRHGRDCRPAASLPSVRPDILVLNAGAKPRMGRLDQLSWADFSAPWETDVRAGLYWLQAALNLPLKPGSRVLVGSSGAAQNGSPLSGGYAGAKRMLWFMAKYANGVSEQKGLGHPLPGDRASADNRRDRGRRRGVQRLRPGGGHRARGFLARFGAPMPPRQFGDHLVAVLDDPQYATGLAFGLKGDTGITILEGEAA